LPRCSSSTVRKKFRDQVPASAPPDPASATTALGDWYTTVLFWRPHVALFVNEPTLLPVVIAFAPAASVLDRFPAAAAEVPKPTVYALTSSLTKSPRWPTAA
jgi:hypothetical protein